MAERAAVADADRRAVQRALRDQTREKTRRIAERDAQVTALSDAVEALARAALLVAGFHRHARGEWRRRRA